MASLLYVRSVYSLLSSMCTIPKMVKKAKEKGYSSIGLVDKNVLSGAMSFYNECLKENIKPVIGLEVGVNVDRIVSVILYAKDDFGFQNLMRLSSVVNTGVDKIIDLDTFNKYRDHNFVVLKSEDVPYFDSEDINNSIKKEKEIFGDHLVAFLDHDMAGNVRRDEKLRPLLNENKIKIIKMSTTLYIEEDDYIAYEVLKCIRDKKTLEENAYYEKDRQIKDAVFDDESINCDVLAENCNVKMAFRTSLPEFKTPNDVSSKDYLSALCKEGLKRRLKNHLTNEYISRLQYELDVIIKMHFEDYFLIVYDFILYAKKKGIMVGPGRGSAAGSLVSYCLGITEIDPIKYGLLFERFLNPERISMPDIDTDFPDDRRDEVVDYVK